MNRSLIVVATLVCATLSGCTSWLTWEEPPRREVRNAPEVEPAPERPVGPSDYMVRKGDTVYSIAFRNSLDYRELAKWNGIGADYLIRPGQVLRLQAPAPARLIEGDIESTPTPLEGPPVSAPVALSSELPPSTAPPPIAPPPPGRARPKPIPLPAQPLPRPVPGTEPSAPAGTSVAVAPVSSGPISSPPPSPPSSVPPVVADPPPLLTSESGAPYRWQWPTQGVVVRGYNPAAGSKGLDFAGDIGQPVVAAAPGKVVYSGAALKGYGELIIIKHDDLRLSAYGYNRTRLVQEGQMVRGGQTIAELGLGPENKPVLHFEIRERGQPVNPVPYLPARTAQN